MLVGNRQSDELDPAVRVGGLLVGDDRSQSGAHLGRADQPEPQGYPQLHGRLLRRPQDVIKGCCGRRGVAAEPLTFCCQRYPGAGAMCQRDSQLAFQVGHALTDARLGHPEPGCGVREVQLLGQ